MEDCIFCKIVKGEAPSTKEYEDDDILVFRNIKPLAPVHLLVIPKRHIINVSEVEESDKETMGKIILVARKMAEKMGISDAFRIAVANGENAGQSVFHLHFHLVGGWKEKNSCPEDEV